MNKIEEPVVKIEDLDVQTASLGKVNDIKMQLGNKTITALVCSEKEGKLISLAITGRIRRRHGKIFVNEAYIPAFPRSISKKLRKKINRSIKYLDLDARTLLTPKMKLIDSLHKLFIEEDFYNQVKLMQKAELEKEILLIIAEEIKDDELSNFLIKKASWKFKQIYAHRNIVHLKQTRRMIRLLSLENFYRILGLQENWKRIKKGLYQAAVNDKITQYIAYSNESFKKTVNKFEEDYQKDKKLYKERLEGIKQEIKEERINLINLFFISRSLKRRITKFCKRKRKLSKVKKEKFKIAKKYILNLDEDSVYQTFKKRISNWIYLLPQWKDWREYKQVWKKYRLLLSLTDKINMKISLKVSAYLKDNTYHQLLLKREKKIINLFVKLNLPLEWLEMQPDQLTIGEQFEISILTSLITSPDIIILKDSKHVDSTLSGQWLKRIKEIQQQFNLSVLFITENIETAIGLASYCYVIKTKVLEKGFSRELLENPVHLFTRQLVKAVLPYGLTNLKWHHSQNIDLHLLTESILEAYHISDSHVVYANNILIKHWMKFSDQYEMDFTKRYALQQARIIEI